MRPITVLIPVYNELNNIPELYKSLDRVTRPLEPYRFTFLFIDDGSTDGSGTFIESLIPADSRVRCIELSRNFGKEAALTAGLDQSEGSAVILTDGSGRHPPSLIPALIRRWEEGFDIVVTRTDPAKRSPARKAVEHLFRKVQSLACEVPVETGITDFMLLDGRVVDTLKAFTERNRIVKGLVLWAGFKQAALSFEPAHRTGRRGGFSLRSLTRTLRNAVTKFSLFPLRAAGYLGSFITAGFLALLIYMLCNEYLLRGEPFTARAYVFTLNSILIGMVLMCLGLIALYIGNIHHEVTNRPLYVLRSRTGLQQPVDEAELEAVSSESA